jgi:predicted kinase
MPVTENPCRDIYIPEYNQTQRITIPEGTLVVLSGLPGSGKSSLRANAIGIELATWLSSDALRDEITPPLRLLVDGKPRLSRNESTNDVVFAIMQMRVRAGLQMGRTVVVDATSPTDADRQTWIDLANEIGAPHLVVILDVSVETCIARASAREAYVPAQSIREMHQPSAPAISPEVKAKAGPNAKLAVTAPQGFQRTSRFNHVTVNNTAQLYFGWKELPVGKWDVIGDVHGLLDNLLVLLGKAGWTVKDGRLQPHPEGRKLLFLGDLVDRGIQSVELLRFVMRAVQDGLALCLKGNHEEKLVRFLRTAKAHGIERWTSYANAETGMNMLKLEDGEREALTQFLVHLPTHFVDVQSRTAFVHADVHVFAPGVSRTEDMLYGMSGWSKVDSDAIYQRGVEAGINEFTVIRGHIPSTSEQSHIYSLERHPFQKGELVLMHFDKVQPVFANAASTKEERIAAFNASLVTERCDFDFEAYSEKYALLKGLESLAEKKHVTRQLDDSKMFRVYKYSKQTFWNNSWDVSPWLLKARGIVCDPAGNIVSHPFDKCFNYLENGTGKDLSDDLDVIVTDKLNGFLGIVSANPLKSNALLVHTQGGFGGDFVGYINDHISPAMKGQMLKFFAKNDVTLMFEVLHKEDPHIVAYPEDMMGLHLIGVRGKQLTDQPWTEAQVDAAAEAMGLRRPQWARMKFGQARAQLRTLQTEGFMVRADTPDQEFLLKMKSPFYLTTKFLGRLSSGRIKHMFANARDFKKTMDEEFFILVDTIVETYSLEQFLEYNDDARVAEVRKLINQMQ